MQRTIAPALMLWCVLALVASAAACRCGCLVRNPVSRSCVTCKPCDVRVPGVKDIVEDPEGFLRDMAISTASGLISKQLEQTLAISNLCDTTAKRNAFSAGGWRPYYGKRMWDSKGVAMIVGSIVPATAAAAQAEVWRELRSQYASAMDMLEKAANDAGEDLQATMQQVLQDIISAAQSGRLVAPVINKKTFGIKAAILRVNCNNKAAGMSMAAEGYYQLAFAYRINMTVATAEPANPPPAQEDICKHDCGRCGRVGNIVSACRKCCWKP